MQMSLDMKAAGRKGSLALLKKGLQLSGDTVIDFVNEITENQHGQTENVLTHFLHRPPMVKCNNGYHLHCFPKFSPTLNKTSSGEVLVDVDSRIEKRTMGWLFYQITARRGNHKFNQVTFKPYRKFGFAFWESERMMELGLLGLKDRVMVSGTPESYGLYGGVFLHQKKTLRDILANAKNMKIEHFNLINSILDLYRSNVEGFLGAKIGIV